VAVASLQFGLRKREYGSNQSILSLRGAVKGSFFVHADEMGFHIGSGVPIGIPVSEIRAIEYTGPRFVEAATVADLKKWFEDRIEEGFYFVLPDVSDAN
jgi:hypothetical protein